MRTVLLLSLLGSSALACLTEHIVQRGQTCLELRAHYGIEEEKFVLWNGDVNCADLEPGTTICVKGRPIAAPSTTDPPTASSTTRQPHQKNLLEVIVGHVLGEDQRLVEAPGPLIYHSFPDYVQED